MSSKTTRKVTSKRKVNSPSENDLCCFRQGLTPCDHLLYAKGNVIEIRMENFMCHSNLSVRLAPRINIILGSNGSGKSALMNALILCLGGRAIQTGRDVRTITSFVKSGERYSEISVVIRNGDQCLFSECGSTLTIVRRISSSGADDRAVSRYKICDENGSVISDSICDIQKVLGELMIDLDNPVCMLSQQLAKDFMMNQNSRKMYEFFGRMTGLNKCWMELDEVENKINSVSQVISEQRRDLEKRKSEYKKYEQIIHGAKLLEIDKANVCELEAELKWTKFLNFDAEIKKKKESLEKYVACRPTLEERFVKFEADIENVTKEISEINERLSKLKVDSAPARMECKETFSLIRSENEKLTLMVQQIKGIEKQIVSLECESKKIDENVHNFMNLHPERMIALRKESDDLRAKIEAKTKTLEVELEVATKTADQKRELTAKFDEIKRDLESIHAQISFKKQSIRTIEADNANDLARFGHEIPSLVSAINANTTRFRTPPIGPLGVHLEVVDSNWQGPIESAIGIGLLKSFICTNYVDEDRLRQIMKSIYRSDRTFMPQIIVQKPLTDRLNTCRKQYRNYGTVYGHLNIKDENVRLALLDIGRIDCILLKEIWW
ncbi:hypothetical protein ACOME3_002136 [Neoechinorhynchus agilis]